MSKRKRIIAGDRRLVVVSNRVTLPRQRSRAGGLSVALLDALKRSGGLWFGWSGEVSEREDNRPSINSHRGLLSTATLDLTPEDYEEYYNGFANSTLWPLFHYRIDLTSYDREFYRGYVRVNERFAHALCPLLRPNDHVWVHDYHLMAFGEELRRMGCNHPMGFFLHIPFPAPEVLTTLPVHEVLVRALFAYDVVGFQTETDRRCFVDYVVSEVNGIEGPDNQLTAFGRTIIAAAFPIGIDAKAFARQATSKEAQIHARRMQRVLNRRLAIIGVDRLDYSKGLPERFHAYRRLLESYPENRGRVSFVQIAPPSRTDVEDYREIRRDLEGLTGAINGEFSEFDWTPLRYINRAFSRPAIAGLLRISRVGLVTPLRDGMNLVAKEYVAAQAARNPGVLVLSRFSGAARQADGALIVNPYDVQSVADALQRALTMPLAERKARWKRLVERVRKEDVNVWRDSFLARLAKTN